MIIEFDVRQRLFEPRLDEDIHLPGKRSAAGDKTGFARLDFSLIREERMFSRLGIQGDTPVLQRQLTIRRLHAPHASMCARLDPRNISGAVYIDPDVLELVQMLDIPVPPDRIFNGVFGVTFQVNKVVARWGAPRVGKHCNADMCRKERFICVKQNAWCKGPRQLDSLFMGTGQQWGNPLVLVPRRRQIFSETKDVSERAELTGATFLPYPPSSDMTRMLVLSDRVNCKDFLQ